MQTQFSVATTLNCGGRLLDLATPQVMGILNVTPDSFYDGGKHANETQLLTQAEKMLSEGAAILDIGGMSSRPGAAIIDENTELMRVIPNVRLLLKHFPGIIVSIDTIRAEVARQAVGEGATMINDISAGNLDVKMLETVAELAVPYVLMHLNGTPATMQTQPINGEIVTTIMDFFIQKIGVLRNLGIKDVVLDVGFGFGKTTEQNYQLLRQLSTFKMLGLPILVGLSRKSMIYKVLNTNAQEALNGTTALNIMALEQGASILRVHDVKEAVEVVNLWQQIT
jgi:dihydropteroate synthase